MMSSSFTTETYGKWILAGEHAVLRGHSALVFPIFTKRLILNYHDNTGELKAEFIGSDGADMHILFWSVLEQGMQVLNRSINSLSGSFHINNNIPIGVGLGASAALCVAMARWFDYKGFLTDISIDAFAKTLEDLFHGTSSGLDIAGVASATGLHFKKGEKIPLKLNWQPNWYLSSCEQIGITSHCIEKVNALWRQNEAYAKQVDEKMQKSVDMAIDALFSNANNNQSLLSNAINTAHDCFLEWGLISDNLQAHIKQLSELGAIAAKPTGSGGGGYVVSLWDAPPTPQAYKFELIPLNGLPG